MNNSRTYLRTLPIEDRKKLASKVSEKKWFHRYLYQIGKNLRTPSREIAARLQKASKGKIKTSDFDKEALQKVSA